jgi:hypothetical protein
MSYELTTFINEGHLEDFNHKKNPVSQLVAEAIEKNERIVLEQDEFLIYSDNLQAAREHLALLEEMFISKEGVGSFIKGNIFDAVTFKEMRVSWNTTNFSTKSVEDYIKMLDLTKQSMIQFVKSESFGSIKKKDVFDSILLIGLASVDVEQSANAGDMYHAIQYCGASQFKSLKAEINKADTVWSKTNFLKAFRTGNAMDAFSEFLFDSEVMTEANLLKKIDLFFERIAEVAKISAKKNNGQAVGSIKGFSSLLHGQGYAISGFYTFVRAVVRMSK